MRVLAEQPGASMSEIAEASGLGRATLYRHFRTRAELVPVLRERLERTRAEELETGLQELCAIARWRWTATT